MSDDQDPLEGADVGETRTVRRSKTLHGINMEPMEFFGTDRQADIRVADLELVEDDEGDLHDVEITWEADLTKNLPRRWDRCTEPRTEGEEKQARRRKWLNRISRASAVILPLVVSYAIGIHVVEGAFENITINGEPMGPVTWMDMAPTLGLVAVLTLILYYGLRGGLPRRAGVGR